MEARRTVMRGESNCPMLTPGYKFTLGRHYRADFNTDYFVVRVRHEASVRNYEKPDGAPFVYQAVFERALSGFPVHAGMDPSENP